MVQFEKLTIDVNGETWKLRRFQTRTSSFEPGMRIMDLRWDRVPTPHPKGPIRVTIKAEPGDGSICDDAEALAMLCRRRIAEMGG